MEGGREGEEGSAGDCAVQCQRWTPRRAAHCTDRIQTNKKPFTSIGQVQEAAAATSFVSLILDLVGRGICAAEQVGSVKCEAYSIWSHLVDA